MLEPKSDHRHCIPDPLSHPPLLWNGWSRARFIPSEDKSLFMLSAVHSSSLLPCPSLVNCFSWFSYDLDNNKYIREAHLQMKKLEHRKLKRLAHDHTGVGRHCFHLAIGGPRLAYLIIFLKDIEMWGKHLLPHVLWVLCDGDLKQRMSHWLVFSFY